MFENLDVFRIASSMARYAGQKQAVVAQNVANSDTPGYVARDLPSFQSFYTGPSLAGEPRATRARHLNSATQAMGAAPVIEVEAAGNPNGNQVSVETEILKSVSAKRQHDRALAIYKSSLSVLRTAMRTS